MTEDREPKMVAMDEEMRALLEILALGSREIEQGKFRDAEEVFSELAAADQPGV